MTHAMIPTEITINEHSMDALYNYYPHELFPKTLRKATGKAKKCGFECIDPNIYEPEANMIAFGTSAKRLPCWIRATWLYIYEYLGSKGNMNVNWDHDPVDKHKLTSVSVEISTKLEKANPLAYKMTIFTNTGTIQVQGNNYQLFVSSHFKTLLAMVNILDKQDVNTKIDSDDTDQTLLKSVQEQNKLNTPSRIPVRSTHVPLEGISSDKLEHLETNLTEALGKFSTMFSQQLQIELKKVYDKLDVVFSNISKLQAKPSGPDKSSKDETLLLKDKIQKLEIENNHLKTETDYKLRTIRSDYELELAKMKSKLDIQTQITNDLQKSNQHLNHNIDHLDEKLSAKNSEIAHLEKACAKLRQDLEAKHDEILSMKMHFGSSQSNQHNDQFVSVTPVQSKPKVLLIGTSNTKDINEERLSGKFVTEKHVAFTFQQTSEKIDSLKSNQYNAVVLHCLTNEIVNESPDTCLTKLDELVVKCRNHWPTAKVIVSLATPRLDNLNVKVELTNALVKNKYWNDENILISDNSNLSHRGAPQDKFLDRERDNYHLNKSGVAQLSANMKVTISDALNIHIFRKPTSKQSTNNSPRNQDRQQKIHNKDRNYNRRQNPNNHSK